MAERSRRQDRLQRAEAAFDALPFDVEAACAYGPVFAAVLAAGRTAGGPRAVDLMIAAIASARGLPLNTRNPDDFGGHGKHTLELRSWVCRRFACRLTSQVARRTSTVK